MAHYIVVRQLERPAEPASLAFGDRRAAPASATCSDGWVGSFAPRSTAHARAADELRSIVAMPASGHDRRGALTTIASHPDVRGRGVGELAAGGADPSP